MAKKTKLALVDDSKILKRLESGEFLRHVAADLGVSHQGLSEHLGPQQCRAALIVGQETHLQRLLERFDELHIPPPPIRPRKKDFATAEDHAAAVSEYRGEREAWKDNSTLPAFELEKLEKEYRSATWYAERSFPERFGVKSMMHLTVGLTLDQILIQMEQEEGRPAIEGESCTVESD